MTIPLPFQAAELDLHALKPAWGHNWDPGTGKSFGAIETAARLRDVGAIGAMVVVAPNGVHRNWATDEIPKHGRPGWRTFLWQTSRASTKAHQLAAEEFERDPAFRVLVVSYDGVMTEDCAKFLKRFLQRRPCLLTLDECHPAGVMVETPAGRVAIETLKVGDEVLSVDHATGVVAVSQVRHIFRKRSSAPILGVEACRLTGEHPVWTRDRGYVPARNLRSDDTICRIGAGLQHDIPADPEELRMVRSRVLGQSSQTQVLREVVLWQGEVREQPRASRAGVQEDQGAAEGPEFSGCAETVSAFGAESVSRSSGAGEGEVGREGQGIPGDQRCVEGWERSRPDGPAGEAVRSSGLAHGGRGVLRSDKHQIGGSAVRLQDRRGQSGEEDRDRGGRVLASERGRSSARCAQGRVLTLGRLDRAAVLELSRDGGALDGSGGDIELYNIETDLGNYFANGLLVHNSHRIKSPDAKRTKRVLAMAAYAPYRRILTGTLVPDKPFDVYSQIKFLDPEAWGRIGCGSFQAFKAQFGVWEQRFAAKAGRFYPELQSYRNLDQMHAVVSSLVSRVRKEDVLSDLPAKTYSRRYFELSPAQRRAYKELRDEAMTTLLSGELVTAPLVITRLMRMQQVTSGYLPSDVPDEDGERPLTFLEGGNPRLACLIDALEDLPHQAIVWAKYRTDITLIGRELDRLGMTWCRYDGACSEEESAQSREDFRSGKAQFFVSNPAKGGEGLTLNEAKTQVFYNTGYKLGERLQAEARNDRIGQDSSIQVIDLLGMLQGDEPTLDLGILRALQSKRELAAQVQGDDVKAWLFPQISDNAASPGAAGG